MKKETILRILKQKSTWAGIGVIIPALGVHFTPEDWNAVVILFTTVSGTILAGVDEDKIKKSE
jgi:hypothetical protein